MTSSTTQALQAELLAGYRSHPSFVFGDQTLPLAPGLAQAFNDAYSILRTYATKFEREGWSAAVTRCQSALDTIFTSLCAAAGDSLEKRFLEELKFECDQLLATEVRYYKLTSQSAPYARLDAPTAFEGTLALERRHHFFGQLPAEALLEIQKVAAPEVMKSRQAAERGELTRGALSCNGGPVVKKIIDILNRAYAKQGVLEAVSAYAGCKMQVMGLALELSVPQSGWWSNTYKQTSRAPHTLYAHIDESIDHPKAIVYLSDVAVENGPTSVYPGIYEALQATPLQELVGRIISNVGHDKSSPLNSHYTRNYHQGMSSENFRRHFMRLPDELLFYSHFGWDVMPDSRFEQTMTVCEHKMIGPAGTYVIFDGARLVHRGGLIQQGERVALQVIFSDAREAYLSRRIFRRIKRHLSWN